MPRHSSPRRRAAVRVVLVEQPARPWSPRTSGRAAARCAAGRPRRRAGRRSACAGRAVRWSCQLSSGPTGSPVAPVPEHERLALGAEADRGDPAGVAARRGSRATAARDAGPDLARRPARPSPAAGGCWPSGDRRRATIAPPASTSSALVELVPWSIARIRSSAWPSPSRSPRGARRCRRRSGRSARAGTTALPVGANCRCTPEDPHRHRAGAAPTSDGDGGAETAGDRWPPRR